MADAAMLCVLRYDGAISAAEMCLIMTSLMVCGALAHRPNQLFDLAADVERYPEFLPRWVSATVLKREGNIYYTDQIVGFIGLRAHFGTKTVLQRPERIDVTSTDWPFRKFHLTWHFEELPTNKCQVVLRFDLKLQSYLLENLFGRAIAAEARSIISAFEARARRLYGPPAAHRSPPRNVPPHGPVTQTD